MPISNPSFGVGLSATVPVAVGQATGNISLNHQVASSYVVGSAAGNVDLVYTAQRTVTSSSSADVIDLSSLTDPAGGAVDFLHVADLIVQNPDSSATLTVGGGTDAVSWLPSAGVAIPPGGAMALHVPSGLVVTPSTAMNLQVATGSGSPVYNVTIFGRSA